MIGYRIDFSENCCKCGSYNVLVSKGLTTVTKYIDVKPNTHCVILGESRDVTITSPTQCAYECRKQNSGFCPFFHTEGFDECWRDQPTGDADCTKKGDQLVGTYALYGVQNIGYDF